jgi:hypothetical protein
MAIFDKLPVGASDSLLQKAKSSKKTEIARPRISK